MKAILGAIVSLAAAGIICDPTWAQASDVTDAQNEANIAQAVATASHAQGVADAALQASLSANTKADIANIQAAFAGPKASDLKTVSGLTAPTVNAAYNRILGEALESWLSSTTGRNPISDIITEKCTRVVMSRPALPVIIQTYRAVDAKLAVMTDNLVKATAMAKSKGNFKENMLPVVAITGAVAAVDLVANFAAAAKQMTAVGSSPLGNADNIVKAMIAARIGDSKSGQSFYDTDLVSAIGYENLGTGACPFDPSQESSKIQTGSLGDKATCFNQALADARAALDGAPANPTDAQVKANIASLSTLVTQSVAVFQAFFTADATGAVPFNAAAQGEFFSGLLTDKAQPVKGDKTPDKTCILSIKTNAADADTVVRDGTFSSYKLSVETTTAISWTIADPKGKIERVGSRILSTQWKRQELDD